MLMYHPDAGRDRFRGGPAGDVAVVDFDRAGIRAKHAAQHSHERRFARPVLAHQGVDLRGRDVQ